MSTASRVALAIPRDANNVPMFDPNIGLVATVSGTFVGGTANARGDYDGTGNPTTLFTVTGTVKIKVFGVCTTLLAGANATLEVGISGSTALLVAQTTATEIDAGELWKDTTPEIGGDTFGTLSEFILTNGADVIETVGTANITSGAIDYFALWYPISPGATVVAA